MVYEGHRLKVTGARTGIYTNLTKCAHILLVPLRLKDNNFLHFYLAFCVLFLQRLQFVNHIIQNFDDDNSVQSACLTLPFYSVLLYYIQPGNIFTFINTGIKNLISSLCKFIENHNLNNTSCVPRLY